MKEYLLLFTIGPVQSFIENSRKMRDLYAGSFLLSHLILHICTMVESFKCDIKIEQIIPVNTGNKTPSVPNRILLKVHFDDNQSLCGEAFMTCKIEKLAKYMESKLRSECQSIYEAIFKKFGIVPNESVLAQLEGFPEVYWVYQEHKGNSVDFEDITSKLHAVKSLRPFAQTTEKAGRKCPLFPEYNAMFYRTKNGKNPKYIDPNAIEIGSNKENSFYALKQGEAISSLAFIKRMLSSIGNEYFSTYQYNRNIVSVALMLLNDYVEDDSKGQSLLKELSPEAAEAVFDLQNGQILSEQDYKLEDITVAEKICSYISEKQISPYYAVVKFDGDGIGELYRNSSAEQQKKLSKEIGKFAGAVPAVMNKYHGMCIYAGGEDFLGFFPAAKAIPTLIELRSVFQETLKHPFNTAKKLTFSAGIVIVHLMPPLKSVLAMTDRMEQLAKNNPDKDSFAMAVSKRSGTKTYICSQFGKDSQKLKILGIISSRILQGSLSISSVYTLLSILDKLEVDDETLKKDILKPIVYSSICPQINSSENDIQNANAIYSLIEQYDYNLQDFISALEIVTFLGKEEMSCTIK